MFGERIRFEREMGDLGLRFPLPREFDEPQPAKCPREVVIKVGKVRKKMVVGGLRFTADAKDDILKGGALLDGPDQAFIGWHNDLLAFDPKNTKPADPFRWNKLKFIIESCQDILVGKKGPNEKFDALLIATNAQNQVIRTPFPMELSNASAGGYTLVTEALHKAVNPNATSAIVSPDTTTYVFYSTVGTLTKDASKSSLPHELFGHTWLALKTVPFAHPSKQGGGGSSTLTATHNILDPFDLPFAGSVTDFIGRFIDRGPTDGLFPPTLRVGHQHYPLVFKAFAAGFTKHAKAKINKPWTLPPPVWGWWRFISANYALAPATHQTGVSRQKIEKDVVDFYAKLTSDRQYVFIMFLTAFSGDISEKGELAGKVLPSLKAPKGMNAQPPPPQTFGGQLSTSPGTSQAPVQQAPPQHAPQNPASP